MAKACLLFVAFAACAPVVAQAPEPSLAQAPSADTNAAGSRVRARVARLAPPFAARVGSRRVSDTTTNASDATLHAGPLAGLTHP
jgi:hypothetical protein